MQLLLDYKASVHSKNVEGYTPLHKSAVGGHTTVADLLLRAKANVLVKTKSGKTAMDLAALRKHTDLTQFLVSKENEAIAQISTDQDGNTALHFAASSGKISALHAVLSSSAPPAINAANKDGNTALHLAVQEGMLLGILPGKKFKTLSFLEVGLDKMNRLCVQIMLI